MTRESSQPAVIVAGGSHNALSIVRSLGRRGIRVFVLNRPASEVRSSRYATGVTLSAQQPFEAALEQFLCGPDSDYLGGAVLLAAGDETLKLISDRHAELAQKFRLDLCNPPAQRCMLDKLATYEAARAAGVPAPRFWVVGSRDELEQRRAELTFPLIVKPRESHLFQQRFRAKFLVAERFEDLAGALEVVERAGVACILMERIPGPDTLLCSYYTYLDESGAALFDFTKRIIRRFPPNMGLATYHITDHVAGIKAPALQLFRHVGLQGLANVEFKLDPRDGQLKLIECNARFTAANCLLAACGLDLAYFVYCRIAGLPVPTLGDYPDGKRLWDPARDAKACIALQRRGELGLVAGLRSVLHRQTFPVFAWHDPLPSVIRLVRQNARLRRPAPAQSVLPAPVLLYDGECGFCTGTIQWVLRREKRTTLRFAALQSPFARRVVERTPGLEGVDSVVWFEPEAPGVPERVLVRSTAVLRIARYLGGFWSLLLVASIVPRPLRDWVYDAFARHRKRFVRNDRCLMPTPDQRRRFVDAA